MAIQTILLILALICFVLSAGGVTSRINLQSLGLAFVMGALLVR